jgi:hypothetical protein
LRESIESRRWWGEFRVEVGKQLRWRVGPAMTWIERRPAEWVIRHRSEGDPFSDQLEVGAPVSDLFADDALAPAHRFAGLAGETETIELCPRLADRDVVSRPEEPFWLVPGSSVTGQVGSPLWLALGLEPGAPPITEFPLLRPSDTWFGSNTRQGKLCYASRTRLRLRREDVRWNPHRAVTEVRIENRGRTPLRVERINVPVPALSLWFDESGLLRTSSISLTRKDDDDEIAELQIDETVLQGAERVALPRAPAPRGLVRAFSRLL